MKILIIGSGGREHALYDKLSQDDNVSQVLVVGNNGGIDKVDLITNILDSDFASIEKVINDNNIQLTIIGPEYYLEAGLTDYLNQRGHNVFAPSKYCSQLESSKHFAKQMMFKRQIPTAKYKYVTNISDGLCTCTEFGYPVVLKYDGLAAGKGVLVCTSETEAKQYFHDVFDDEKFGNCGVVIEECLVGEEYSVFAVVDGQNYCLLPVAQDYKRAYDFDKGLNTGGMGVNTTDKFNDQLPFIENQILKPILEEFANDENPYRGFLYIGLMQTENGPRVIEFNTRLGDPETEIILPKLKTSLFEIIQNVTSGKQTSVEFENEQYVGVTVAAKGYPESYEKDVILEVGNINNKIIHMGTTLEEGTLISTGGRILLIVAKGHSVQAAREKVYHDLEKLKNDKLFWRLDIGLNRM